MRTMIILTEHLEIWAYSSGQTGYFLCMWGKESKLLEQLFKIRSKSPVGSLPVRLLLGRFPAIQICSLSQNVIDHKGLHSLSSSS